MISLQFKFDPAKLFKDMQSGSYPKKNDAFIRGLFRVGGYVKRIAKNSVRASQKKKERTFVDQSGKERKVLSYVPSKPGKPPRTHGNRKALKNAVAFEVDKIRGTVNVGPRASSVGDFARFHEFGGTRKGTTFPKRPFMGPALTKALPKIPPEFKNIL